MRFFSFLILVLLLLPLTGTAQKTKNPNSGSIPLPDSSFNALDRFFREKFLLVFESVPFTISSQTEFDTLLDSETRKKIAPIDFSKYDLRWLKYCSTCIANCPDPENPCHRSACRYSSSWVISPKPGNKITVEIFSGNKCDNLSGTKRFLIIDNDSAYHAFTMNCTTGGSALTPDFSKYVLLVREENQDCNAEFVSDVFQDSATNTITWRLRSRYGGCRGMQTTVHQILVPRMPGAVYRFE